VPHFFPCHFCASLPRRDGGVGRYSRSALPSQATPGTLTFWTALASFCSYRSLGAAVLPLWEICCAVLCCALLLELPLPIHGGADRRCTRHTSNDTSNDTIKAFEPRVWHTTTEKFSLQAVQAA